MENRELKKSGRPVQVFQNGEKVCCACDVSKPIGEFHKRKNTAAGVQPNCKSCYSAYRAKNQERYKRNYKERYISDPTYKKNLQKYYQKNIAVIREKKRELYKCPIKSMSRRAANYKRRALEKSTCDGSVNAASLRDKLISQNGLCAISGKSLLCGFHLDHIIPISKGGTHTIGNVQFVNAEENIRKSNKLIYPSV